MVLFGFFVSEEQVLGQSMKSTLNKVDSTLLLPQKNEFSRGNPHLQKSDPQEFVISHLWTNFACPSRSSGVEFIAGSVSQLEVPWRIRAAVQ